MCSASRWTITVLLLENIHTHGSSESSRCVASSVYKEGRLASHSLCCGLVSVDPYHAPLGNAGLCKCLQITIFLK